MKELLIPDTEVVYLPKNLNLEEMIRVHPPTVLRFDKNPGKVVERIAVILGQINARRIHNKDLEEGYVPLNSALLQKLVEDYSTILKWAVQADIIETDGHYTPDKSSKGYRFTGQWWKENRKYYIQDEILIRKLRERRLDGKSVRKLPFLYQCLQEIEIDEVGAMEEMKRLSRQELESPDIRETRLHSRIAAIDMLVNKKFFFKRDQRVGRLHTNITGLKREARKFLTWQGNELVNIDIRNSQPYFSLALFKNVHKLNIPQLLSHFNPKLTKPPTHSPMLGKYRDISVFEELVVNGMLYEALGAKIGMTRAEAKKLIFNIFFSVPGWTFAGKDQFISLFPEVWEVFEWVNTGFYQTKKQGRKKTDQSNALAMLLQKIEATVILDHVVPRIETECKGLPVWTIHDSIMTLRGHEDIVAQVIKEEAKRVIGVAPSVSYE